MSAVRIALGALVLLAGTSAPVAADHGYWPDGGVDPAAVTGHRPPAEGSLDPASWGPACVAVNTLDVYGHVLDANHELAVIVAEVNSPFAITLFEEPKAGEFLWADTNGDNQFAGHEADAAALIVCEEADYPGMPPTDTAAIRDASMPGWAMPGVSIGNAALVALCGAAVASMADRRQRRRPT